MSIKSHITDPRNSKKVRVIGGQEHNALAVVTRPLKEFTNTPKVFADPNGSTDLNISVAFGATPDEAFDGTDRTLWTGSNPVGVGFTEDSADHAKNAIATITAFGSMDADTAVTVSVNGVSVGAVTAPGDYTIGVSNDATATSLASALDGKTGINATATAAVINIISTTTGDDITDITHDDAGGGITVSALSINASASTHNDTFQIDRGSDLDLTGYQSISGYIWVDAWSAVGTKAVELYGYDVDSTTELGVRVDIGDYIDTGTFDVWQKFIIPLVDLGLNGLATTFDGIRITTIDIGGGAAPDYYLDLIRVEQTGTANPVTFSIEPDKGTWLYIGSLSINLADALDTAKVNGTMPGLSYDQILGESALSGGIVYQEVINGEVSRTINFKQLSDILILPWTYIDDQMCDGTNTFITIISKINEPIILKPENEDKIRITISEDLSGLLLFKVTAACKTERRALDQSRSLPIDSRLDDENI